MTVIKNTIQKTLSEPYESFGVWWVKVQTNIHAEITIMALDKKTIQQKKAGSVFY